MSLLSILVLLNAISSLIITTWLRRLAVKKNLFDTPNERSSHYTPIPRIGGLSIIITWFPSIVLLYLSDYIEKNLFLALLFGLPIAIVSLVDDIKNVKPIIRLTIHFISAIGAFYFLDLLRPFSTYNIAFDYPWLTSPITIICMVWFINMFNFMDGIDGFAATEAVFILAVLFVFSQNIICIVLIAAILGFLFWNWPKAEIFMGDLGSTQLGFILIVLGIYFHNNLSFSILNWLMLAAPFWFDATFTLLKRWKNNEKISQPHRKHAYQRLVIAGYSHRQVLFLLIVFNSIIFFLILLYREFDFLKIPLTFTTVIFMYLLDRKVDKLVPFK